MSNRSSTSSRSKSAESASSHSSSDAAARHPVAPEAEQRRVGDAAELASCDNKCSKRQLRLPRAPSMLERIVQATVAPYAIYLDAARISPRYRHVIQKDMGTSYRDIVHSQAAASRCDRATMELTLAQRIAEERNASKRKCSPRIPKSDGATPRYMNATASSSTPRGEVRADTPKPRTTKCAPPSPRLLARPDTARAPPPPSSGPPSLKLPLGQLVKRFYETPVAHSNAQRESLLHRYLDRVAAPASPKPPREGADTRAPAVSVVERLGVIEVERRKKHAEEMLQKHLPRPPPVHVRHREHKIREKELVRRLHDNEVVHIRNTMQQLQQRSEAAQSQRSIHNGKHVTEGEWREILERLAPVPSAT